MTNSSATILDSGNWYVRRGEREIGPLGNDALRALVGTGQITADTDLRRDGSSRWTAAAALPGVLGPRAGVPLAPVADSPRVADAPRDLARPWRRYWARSLDLAVSTFLAAVLVSAVRPSFLTQFGVGTGDRWAILLILVPFALAMDALIHWALGNTPGKALAGIKALEEGGQRPLRGGAYLARNFRLYVFGLGLGLPLVSLITLIVSYRRAASGQALAWDAAARSRVYVLAGTELRTWMAAGIYILGIAALCALGLRTQNDNSRYTAAHTPAPILQDELTQAANSVNATAPRMIDSITRLDGAHAGPGPLFTYEYTLTNMDAAQVPAVALESLRWRLSAHIRQAVCRGTVFKAMLLTGTTVRFHYRDREGQQVASVSVASADCAG